MIDAYVTADQISAIAGKLRSAARLVLPLERLAIALSIASERWRDRGYALRCETVGAIGAAWGWSEALIEESIDALMAPMSRSTLEDMVHRLPRRSRLVAMILPGNIPGAGIHEFAVGLLAGCALIIKTATAEPFFFSRFARTLREVDAEVGALVIVLNWSRARYDLTTALRTSCDLFAAFGSDETIAALDSPLICATSRSGALAAAFGSRVSGALVAAEVAAGPDSILAAEALARDICLFEQQGCLSPHHIFIESMDSVVTANFCSALAAALERFAARVPPPRRYGLEDAAAVRRVREAARWRAFGGGAVALVEGGNLDWTLVSDNRANFTISPGYRTVTVSGFANLDDLKLRLQTVTGRIEAFAIAALKGRFESLRAILESLGVCYVCEPGAMQSPPLDWSHGGGAFMRALAGLR
jgi:Acyl-CoA reductase (LuxC)